MATAQLVVGPPGSGKSTYCNGMQQFLSSLGRPVTVINLDPANDSLPYPCNVNIFELIKLDEVMERFKLGPNGALIYCMEYLENNFEWLLDKLSSNDQYYLIDCPGQVELYTHNSSLKNIIKKLEEKGMRIVSVHLVESQYCNDPSKYVSSLLLSLSCMLQIELPHVNLLSKMDLFQNFNHLAFGIDYYTEVLDLSYLLELLPENPFFRRYKALNEALIGVIEDYSLVSFIPINIQDKESVMGVVQVIDKASGYIPTQNEKNILNSGVL
jgi:GTPase SAR1 family protein